MTAATGRMFRETGRYPIALVAGRHFDDPEPKNTSTTNYDGQWSYDVHVYGQAEPENENDYSDYTNLEQIANDFLEALLADPEWELAGIAYDEATLAGSEIIVCRMEVTKFETLRF